MPGASLADLTDIDSVETDLLRPASDEKRPVDFASRLFIKTGLDLRRASSDAEGPKLWQDILVALQQSWRSVLPLLASRPLIFDACSANEELVERRLSPADADDASSCSKRVVATKEEEERKGVRKSKWISALHSSSEDTLENVSLAKIETKSLAMVGPAVSGRRLYAAFKSGASIAGYLWVRGSSSLVHPAELLHLEEQPFIRVARLEHEDNEHDDWLPAIPNEEELKTLSVSFGEPAGTC
ncbi:hypothetical protein ACSSS7_004883 [Eimeria intestinalis]